MTPKPVVLVTGATRGLGYALAVEAAKRGAHVLALGRTQGALEDLADAIEKTSGAITMIPGDVTDHDAIAYMAQSIFKRFNRLNYWFHTAWFTAPSQPVAYMIGKDVDKAVAVNLRATAHLIHVLDPILRNTEGARAVFFDDDSIRDANMANLRATKAAQIALVDSWAREAVKLGPEVIIEHPEPMISGLRATLYPGEDRSQLAQPTDVAQDIIARVWR